MNNIEIYNSCMATQNDKVSYVKKNYKLSHSIEFPKNTKNYLISFYVQQITFMSKDLLSVVQNLKMKLKSYPISSKPILH